MQKSNQNSIKSKDFNKMNEQRHGNLYIAVTFF